MPDRVAVRRRRRVRAARSPPRSCERHPRLELERRHRAHRRRPPSRRPLPALPRAAELEAFDADGIAAAADVAFVAYPHGAAAPVVEDLRERGLQGGRPVGRLPPRPRALRALVPGARGARAARRGRLRPDRAAPRRDRGRPRWSPRPAATRPPRSSRSRRSRAGLIATRRRRRERRLRRRPRGHRRPPTSSRSTRTSTPTRSRATATRAELEQELASERAGHLHAAPAAARPGPAGELLRDARPRRARTSARPATADAYADEPFVELADAPPGVRDVRDTNLLPDPRDRRPDGRVLVFAAIDNLWKGAAGQAVQDLNLMLGLTRRRGWHERERRSRHLLPLALGRPPGARRGARRRRCCRRASAPRASRPASSRRGLDVGVLACDEADTVVRRALHDATRAWARP